MLLELTIENVAVIRRANIAFAEGFNVFTGETGAGKSILIGAIGAVLGQRTSKDLIRTGEARARVGALFSRLSVPVLTTLSEMGFDLEPGDELLIEREMTADHNICRINGRPASVVMLRGIGAQLVATHGQQDTQSLTSSESHLQFVDTFGRLDGMLDAFRESFEHYRAICRRLESIETDEAAKARRIDLLRYQVEEISACSLVDGEEEDLTARRRVIRNTAQLTELLSRCRENLCGGDAFTGALSLISDTSRALGEAGRYFDGMEKLSDTVAGFGYELDDIAEQLRASLEQLEYDPRELDDIEERLDAISRLKKKYGGSIREILTFGEEAQQKLDEIELSSRTLAELSNERAAALQKATEQAQALTRARVASANLLIEAVTAELIALDMPSVRIEMTISPGPLTASGADEAEFLLSVNPGEAPRPLAKIASGGELSRIMLALKNVISGNDDIDTLIFDEIDAGISGRAAQKVGAKLRSVARGRQVICVTHLAQVASFGDYHLLIDKYVEDGRTFTRISPLDEGGRAQELARIMGGEPITPLSLESARQLLGNARKSS